MTKGLYLRLAISKPEVVWMNTMETILRIIQEEGRITPTVLAKKIGKSRVLVNVYLRALENLGIVRRVGRGLYELTEEGACLIKNSSHQ
ncbi:winged helix-turn-helix domain-containing protein [bacterium]|nr:winged helix-turn-helix domain-containing protein [bacterium]